MTHIKSGARHSATDQQAIQDGHDALVRAGAVCAATKAWTPPQAIKSVGGGRVEGLLCRYSDPMSTDLEFDFFNKSTDFGVKDGAELITLWHHNVDPNKRGAIGKGIVRYTDAGLWYQAWISQRDEYEKFILKMIEMGKAGYSGGAVAIARLASVGKSRLIAKFHLVEGSITPTPMDPGNAVSLKALVLKAQPDKTRQAWAATFRRQDDARARRIMAELDELNAERALDVLDDLDDLKRQMRIEAELRKLEG
jgi:hypothetical protein